MNRSIKNRKSKRKPGKAPIVQAENAQTAVLKEMLTVLYETSRTTPPRVKDIEMPFLKRGKIYTCTRQVATSPIVVTTTVDTNFAYAFHLNDFPDFTDFTNLFDEYRIGAVRVSFTPIPGSASVPSVLVTAIDYDDLTLIPRANLEEYDSCVIAQMTTPFYRTFQPRPALAAYGGASFNAFANPSASLWMDCTTPGVPYYALKGQVPASTFAGGPSTVWDVSFTAILQFRHTR